MSDLEHRVRALEEQIEVLTRALGLAFVGADAAVDWARKSIDAAREGKYRYTRDPKADESTLPVPAMRKSESGPGPTVAGSPSPEPISAGSGREQASNQVTPKSGGSGVVSP